MSYGEYKFGDFAKLYDVGGPSDALVGFAQGFAQGFVPAYQAANKAAADKELALAKLDKAAQLDAKKAKTEANSEYEKNMKSARAIVSGLQLPEGVEESATSLYVFGQLNDAGLTPNQVTTDLTKAIEEGRFNYSDTFTDEPTPPPPAADTPAEPPAEPTQLETEMNEAFGDQSSVVDPEPASTEVSEAPTTEDGSYETASLGTGWAEEYAKRQGDRVNAASETQIAALETQTDVTNPDGLGGGSASASDVILADADGETTESEQVAATQRTLKINPAAKKKVADEIEIEKIDTYAKALAAVTALTGSGQDDKLKRARFLLKQFTETPNIGTMNLQELQSFMELTNPEAGVAPKYKNIDPQVMASLRLYAKDFIQDLQSDALPSLSESDPNVLRGIQSDIKVGKLTASLVYRNELAARIKALVEAAETKRVNGLSPKDYLQEMQMTFLRSLDPNLSVEDRQAALDRWQETEGALYLDAVNFTNDPEKDREFNSVEESAVTTMRESDAWKEAEKNNDTEALQEMEDALKDRLRNPEKFDFVTESARYNLMLQSDDPAQRAAAEEWFNTIGAAWSEALAQKAAATTKPGEKPQFMVTYTDPETGATARATGVESDGGFQLIGKKNADGSPMVVQGSARPMEEQQYIDKLKAQTSVQRKDHRTKTLAVASLSREAYELEQIATRTPEVLTLVGGAVSGLESAKINLDAFYDLIVGKAEQGADAGIPIEEVQSTISMLLDDMFKGNRVNSRVATDYKLFSAALTRFVFAAGKSLGQQGNGFSNADYKNILASLKAGNNIDTFQKNIRSFVKARGGEWNDSYDSLAGDLDPLRQMGVTFAFEDKTFEDWAASQDVNYAEWLESPTKSQVSQIEGISNSTVQTWSDLYKNGQATADNIAGALRQKAQQAGMDETRIDAYVQDALGKITGTGGQ